MKQENISNKFKPSKKLEAVLDQLSSVLVFEQKPTKSQTGAKKKIKT